MIMIIIKQFNKFYHNVVVDSDDNDHTAKNIIINLYCNKILKNRFFKKNNKIVRKMFCCTVKKDKVKFKYY